MSSDLELYFVAFGVFLTYGLANHLYKVDPEIDMTLDGMLVDLVYYSKKLKWNSARQVCQSKSGDLAKIDSYDMLENMKEIAMINHGTNIFSDDYWTGLVQPESGQYIWASDCSQLEDTERVKISDWDENRQCVVMKKDTHVGDRMACDNDKAFMCQIPTGIPCPLHLRLESYLLTSVNQAQAHDCELQCMFNSSCIGVMTISDNCTLLARSFTGLGELEVKTKYCFNVTTDTSTYSNSVSGKLPIHNCSLVISPTSVLPSPSTALTSSSFLFPSSSILSCNSFTTTETVEVTTTALATVTISIPSLPLIGGQTALTVIETLTTTLTTIVSSNLIVTQTSLTFVTSTIQEIITPSSALSLCSDAFNAVSKVLNSSEAEQIAEEISKNLTVEPKSTSTYKRSKISAQDDRSSAKTMGVVGLIFVIVPLASIILYDSKKIFADIMRFENIIKK